MKSYQDAPEIIKSFLVYHDTIKAHSPRTVDEYYLDLRNFFRFLKIIKNKVPRDMPIDEISISDIDLEFVSSVTLSDIYEYLAFLSRDRKKHRNSTNSEKGLNPASRARKIATIRSYYKYLSTKGGYSIENPVKDLDSPKIMKALPRYLSVDEAKDLLTNVEGTNKERDYCIISIFLNCGIRISELVGLNISDIRADSIRVLGKGNKERILFLNDATADAINQYLTVRKSIVSADPNAFFLSSRRERISKSTVHSLIKKHLDAAGIDSTKYSAHKLRHTAATLMLHNGVDVRTLQELLGHEHLNTTEIYTHVENQNLREAAQLSPLAEFIVENEKDETD